MLQVPIQCSNFSQYLLECFREPTSQEETVPFLLGTWPISEVFGTAQTERMQTLREPDPSQLEDDLHLSWRRLSWHARSREILQRRRVMGSTTEDAGKVQVIAREGPACIPASLLSASLGFSMQLTSESLADFLEKDDVLVGSHLVLAGLPDEFPDRLLFSRLALFRDALDQGKPWREMPLFTMLCARDLASLSWLVAKWILTSRLPERTEVEGHFARFTPSDSGSPYHFLTHTREGSVTGQRTYTPDEFATQVLESIDLLAVPTHGFEACANGGGGLVLCGLNSALPVLPIGLTGVLACARGYDCPRGPHPIPLSQFRSKVLMVASCNGLRLADSVLQPHFNLGLAFADGEGLAYVSTLFSATGNIAASSVFSAAMASGHNLGESLALVNGFLYRAGLDHPGYVAIGNPKLTLGAASFFEMEIAEHDPAHIAVDCGRTNMAEIVVRSGELATMADRGDLRLSITGQTETTYWFSLPENKETLRLFLFRFPTSLYERLDISFSSREKLDESCRQVLKSLRHWLEFNDISGDTSDFWSRVRETAGELERGLASALSRSSYDASALARAKEQIRLLNELISTTRDHVIETLSEELLKAFWLTNIYAQAYRTEAVATTVCPNCESDSVMRILCRPLYEDRRKCVICPRCGIVSDVSAEGGIRLVQILAPESVTREETWELEIRIEMNDHTQDRSVLICPRVSANGWSSALSQPPYTLANVAGSSISVTRFRYSIPANVPPHRYFLKALVASNGEIAFGTKVLHVL